MKTPHYNGNKPYNYFPEEIKRLETWGDLRKTNYIHQFDGFKKEISILSISMLSQIQHSWLYLFK